MKVLLQLPSVVQPVSMSVFMETGKPYSLSQADVDVLMLADSLQSAGIVVAFLSDSLFSEDGPHIPIDELRQLAAGALRFAEDIPQTRKQLAYEQLSRACRHELAEIVINQPKLRLQHDDTLSLISPDTNYESYEINPLYGLLFPRDHFINVGGQPIFGHLKRKDRSREVEVVKKVVAAHGHTPIELNHVLEGGDFQENEQIAMINFGFRTEKEVLHFLLDSSLLKTDIVLAVKDEWHNPEQFHLDHYVCLLRDTLLIDTQRSQAINRSRVSIYRKNAHGWSMTDENLTLQQAAQIVGIKPLLLNEDMMASWCANAFTIGNHIWFSKEAPIRLIDVLSAKGYETHPIAFSENQKQFGSIHCSTQLI